MYAIFIRGRREPLTCDDYFGRQLKDQWQKGFAENALLEIEEATFPARTIVRIESNWITERSQEGEREANTAYYADLAHKHRVFLSLERQKSKEELSKNLSLPDLVFYAATGHKVPKELVEEVQARQLAYFKDNPEEIYASPLCYKDLIKTPADIISKEESLPIPWAIRTHAMNMVERVIVASREGVHNSTESAF